MLLYHNNGIQRRLHATIYTCPDPLHFVQMISSEIYMVPLPRQVWHLLSSTVPDPAQVEHSFGTLAGIAPVPLHLPQMAFSLIDFIVYVFFKSIKTSVSLYEITDKYLHSYAFLFQYCEMLFLYSNINLNHLWSFRTFKRLAFVVIQLFSESWDRDSAKNKSHLPLLWRG